MCDKHCDTPANTDTRIGGYQKWYPDPYPRRSVSMIRADPPYLCISLTIVERETKRAENFWNNVCTVSFMQGIDRYIGYDLTDLGEVK